MCDEEQETGSVEAEKVDLSNPELGATTWEIQKISAQAIVDKQQEALTRLREGVTALRVAGTATPQAIAELNRQYRIEISQIGSGLTKADIARLMPESANTAKAERLADLCRQAQRVVEADKYGPNRPPVKSK